MGPVRRAVQITLNLTIALHDIEDTDVSPGDVDVPSQEFAQLPAARQAELMGQVRENAQALIDGLLIRPDFEERVIPALVASLIEADLPDLINAQLGLEENSLSEIERETLEQIWGPAGDRMRAAEQLGDVWTPLAYLNATALTIRDIHIREE